GGGWWGSWGNLWNSGHSGSVAVCRFCSRYTSSAAGTNLAASSSTFGSDQTDRLAMTPLFQVQASGWPFIAHRRIGLSAFWAALTPSPNGGGPSAGLLHRWSDFGGMRSRHWARVLSVSSPGGSAADHPAAGNPATAVTRRTRSIGSPPEQWARQPRPHDGMRLAPRRRRSASSQTAPRVQVDSPSGS